MTRSKRQQGDVPCLLDRLGQAPLVRGANTRQPPGHNLAALSHKSLQQPHVAVGDCVNLFRTELANLLATEKLATPARSAAGASAWTGTTAARSRARPRALSLSRTRSGPLSALRSCGCARLVRLTRSLFSHCVSSLLSSLHRALADADKLCSSGQPEPTAGHGTAGKSRFSTLRRSLERLQRPQQEQHAQVQTPEVPEQPPVPRSAFCVCRAMPSPWPTASLPHRCAR